MKKITKEESQQNVRDTAIQFKNVLLKHYGSFGENMLSECLENILETYQELNIKTGIMDFGEYLDYLKKQ